MPEMRFRIRWPDGTAETCYSPSLVIKDYFSRRAQTYPLADFRRRAAAPRSTSPANGSRPNTAMPCSRAMDQLARIETAAERIRASPDARVIVDAFEE